MNTLSPRWSLVTGSLRGRLARGREKLRQRLTRRGLDLPAGVVALLAPTAVSDQLRAACLRNLAAPTAPTVSALAAGWTDVLKLKAIGLGLLVVAATGLGAALSLIPAPQPETPSAPSPAAPPTQAKDEPRRDRYGDPLPPGAVARIGTVRWWYGRSHWPLVYTPDGKSLVFRDGKGTVHILDAATGKELRHINVPNEGGGCCFALSPNGKTIGTAGFRSPVIRIWDVHTGKELRRIEGGKSGIDAVAFSPDGKTFAAGMKTGIRLWDSSTWKEIRQFSGKDAGYSNGIFFLLDGKTVISGGRESVIWWDIATGQEIRRINREKDGKPGGFYFLAVSPDGKRVAAIHSSNVLLLWDAANGKEIRRVEVKPQFSGSCLCFSPDGQTLVWGNGLGNWGNQTVFFAAATGEELRRWDEGNNHTRQLAFSPDGTTLAQAMSGVIRLRDVKTGKPAVAEPGLPNSCLAVRFSEDGKTLIAGCRGGRIGMWRPRTGEPLTPLCDSPESFGRPTDMLLGPALTADGERAALVNPKGVLHVWEPTTGKVCCRIAEPLVGEDQADFSADGKVVAVKHQDNLIRLWDARNGKLLCALPRMSEMRFPHPHAFSPNGRSLAVAASSPEKGIGMIQLCETATGKEEGRLVWRDHTDASRLVFSPDGKYLVTAHQQRDPFMSGSTDGQGEKNALRLWDRNSGREVRRFPARGDDIRALVISPDGKTVAAAVWDTITLWELASGKERGRFTGHRDWIWSLAFSPDGRLLASGGLDYTACVWDMTGICPDGKWPPRPEELGDLERLWADLGDKDGARAYRALWQLVAAPSAVAFLARRLRPVPRVEEERLAHLLADLDSDQFETRERASQELQRLGERAELALRKALANKPSLEMSRRLRALLDRVESRTLTAEQLHALRAVEVLEHVGTAEARTVLRSLAAGAPADCLTREAKMSLQRLNGRTVPDP